MDFLNTDITDLVTKRYFAEKRDDNTNFFVWRSTVQVVQDGTKVPK